MKCKLYHLLGMIGTVCIYQQNGYASLSQQSQSAVIDTTSQVVKKTIWVKDKLSSKVLDSVRVTLGQESKYTNQGLVEFYNNRDSVIILEKPTYLRTGKRVTSSEITVRLLKRTSMDDNFSFDPTVKSEQIRNTGVRMITGDNLRQVSTLSIMDGLQVYIPSMFVNRDPAAGNNPNVLAPMYLRGMNSFPFAPLGANKNVSIGTQVNPSSGDFRAYTIVQPNSPIFLLDGVQVSAQVIQDIDINRIKSVSLLDGADETAGYGLRGGNGIIAVSTERPKGKFQISFTEQMQLVTPDIHQLQMLNAKQKLELEKSAGLFDDPAWQSVFQKRYEQAYTNNINTNWLEVPLGNQLGTKHSLSMSAGNEDIVYGLDAGYNDIKGVMQGSGRKILDLGAYFAGRIGSVTFNNHFTYLGVDATNSPYGTYDQYQRMNPYWQNTDPITGKLQKIVESDTINGVPVNFTNPAFNTSLSTTDKSSYTRFSNLTNLNWIIGSGFQLNGMVNIARQSDDSDYFLPPNHTVFADISAENLFKRGRYEKVNNAFFDVQGGLRLKYQYDFGKNNIIVNLGQFINQTSSTSEGIAVSGFAVDRLADISFGNAYAIAKPVSGKIISRYASSFANVVYSYDQRYQINVAGTVDYYSGSSRSSISNSIGATWNLHNESFLKGVTWLNLLKVRGSVGSSGNQNYLNYLNRNTYNYYTDQQYIPKGSSMGTIGLGLGAYLTGIGNDQLKSPTVFKEDLSMDLALFRNRLALNILYFHQSSKNLILPALSASTSGFQDFSYYTNAGKMESKGVEFNLLGRIVDNPKTAFQFDIMLNAFHGTDKITASDPYIQKLNELYNQADQRILQPQYIQGYSPNALWAVPSLGIDPQTGNELFRKKDGSTTMIWDAQDKICAGDLTPDWRGSLGFNVRFKQFSFASYFRYALGAHVYNNLQAGLENANIQDNLDMNALSNLRWTANRSDASYKAMFHSPTYATTRFVAKENKLHGASISFGYQFSQQLLEKVNVKQLGIRFMMNNLFDIKNTGLTQQYFHYPEQRSYSFILNATF
ncbi:TonB-dependent receptor [Sphingobacterium detergens]|uniref:TonB-dependent receptor-like protein n=1 Tax=Sphingobacterium detergens TaxID=1145106 RepID=A0A420AQH4_SPHD1|nr:TonB-dependent receptor [Sphingobacterium detergens]RKE46731.1 TonB-dependent receptor-like protein [Sphingobacterium detergens]